MEDDLNRSSFREAPRSSRADSCGPSQGSSTQPQKAIPVSKQGPSKEGNAATVGSVATQSQEGSAVGSHVDERGGEVVNDLVHGADYGGFTPTRINSSLVDDEVAAARLEYQY
jgi:hypothetical protein